MAQEEADRKAAEEARKEEERLAEIQRIADEEAAALAAQEAEKQRLA